MDYVSLTIGLLAAALALLALALKDTRAEVRRLRDRLDRLTGR